MPNIAKIHANDCSKRAVETMNRNIKENGVEHIVSAANHDAVYRTYNSFLRFSSLSQGFQKHVFFFTGGYCKNYRLKTRQSTLSI